MCTKGLKGWQGKPQASQLGLQIGNTFSSAALEQDQCNYHDNASNQAECVATLRLNANNSLDRTPP